jgi:quercetin dioxygenase-like cupin family protein
MTAEPLSGPSWDSIPVVQQFEGATFQAISGEGATIAKFHLRKGTKSPPSKHPQEQFTYIIEGRLRYNIGGEEILAKSGDWLLVKSDVVHRAEVLEDSIVLDFFAPAWPDIPNRAD